MKDRCKQTHEYILTRNIYSDGGTNFKRGHRQLRDVKSDKGGSEEASRVDGDFFYQLKI